jgi:hypothetical protein
MISSCVFLSLLRTLHGVAEEEKIMRDGETFMAAVRLLNVRTELFRYVQFAAGLLPPLTLAAFLFLRME